MGFAIFESLWITRRRSGGEKKEDLRRGSSSNKTTVTADSTLFKQFFEIFILTVTLRTGSTEPMAPKYAFIGTKRLQIGKMFQETPSEI